MMLWLQRSNPKFRQLVAVDCDFSVFERAWCVAELVAAHNAKMPQSVSVQERQFCCYTRKKRGETVNFEWLLPVSPERM
jgi:hypothetical protein